MSSTAATVTEITAFELPTVDTTWECFNLLHGDWVPVAESEIPDFERSEMHTFPMGYFNVGTTHYLVIPRGSSTSDTVDMLNYANSQVGEPKDLVESAAIHLSHLDEQVSTILSAVQSIQAHLSPPAAPVPPSDVWFYSWATGTWAIAEASTIPEKIASREVRGKADANRGYWLRVHRDMSPQKLVERLNQAAVHFSAGNPIANLADRLLDLVGGKKRGTVIEKLEQVYRMVRDEMSWMDEVEGQVRNRPKGTR